jgi:hypothetical protein
MNTSPRKYQRPFDPRFKADYITSSDFEPAPFLLEHLIFSSNIIAIGQYEGILQYRHCPRNSYGPIQCVIYGFQVESYLKLSSQLEGDSFLDGGNNKFLKIFHLGGPLIWEDRNSKQRGIGYKKIGLSFPLLNNRYIVFLKDPKIHNTLMIKNGYLEYSQDGEIKGENHYADEFEYNYGKYGMVLLKDNRAVAGQVVDDPKNAHWNIGANVYRGKSGSPNLQVTNVSETEAINNIKTIVAKQLIQSKG